MISSCLQGEIPKDLRGTLFRNGPGNFEYGRNEPGAKDKSKQNGHPFEGDGLLWNFAFEDDSKIFMRKKFARTKCLQEEMNAGESLQLDLAWLSHCLVSC